VKGKVVSFMEHTSLDSYVAMYRFHSGAPDASNYRAAAQEIMDRLQANLSIAGIPRLEFETLERPASAAPSEKAQHQVCVKGNEVRILL
ncbi:hypothetical protein ACC763_39185, partial [Rhizobium ruizarguesonis]